ncbi:MAG: hypothetical protein NVSMB51_18390 [Solirubrobacteraceae bacterium]
MQFRNKLVGVGISAALLAGGALGGSVLSATAASTGSTTSPSAPAGAPQGAPDRPPGGKFVPNTNPAHEAAERPAHAAQENAGQFPTAP